MMSILQDIKDASLAARKARESAKALSLTTLYSEAFMIGKNDGGRETTDAETIAVVKKFIKNIDESLAALSEGDVRVVILSHERLVFNDFLPKQLSEADIRAGLTKLKIDLNLSVPKDMGPLLREFKTRYEGTYDGAVASKIAKEILA